MIIDCFTFFNELDLLEIRLNELSGVVDRFVIAESTHTFQGKEKPLYFHENRSRYARFIDRIEYILVDDMPLGNQPEDAWRREAHQRRALARGLSHGSGDDFVILSDVDEIPNPVMIVGASHIKAPPQTIHCFELRMFLYYLNLEDPRGWRRLGPRMMRLGQITDMQSLRRVRPPTDGSLNGMTRWLSACLDMKNMVRLLVHQDAGWHFSYMNGQDAVMAKLDAYAHPLEPEWRDPRWIEQRIAAGLPLRPRDETRLLRKPIDASFPSYLSQHKERYQAFILAG